MLLLACWNVAALAQHCVLHAHGVQEVTGTFEQLQQQMMSLRLLASDEGSSAGSGKPAGNSPMRNSRSRSVAACQTLPDTLPTQPPPSQRQQQVELLLDQWHRRMEDDLHELMEAVRGISTTVGAVCSLSSTIHTHTPHMHLPCRHFGAHGFCKCAPDIQHGSHGGLGLAVMLATQASRQCTPR